jgi:hypothetical protein
MRLVTLVPEKGDGGEVPLCLGDEGRSLWFMHGARVRGVPHTRLTYG